LAADHELKTLAADDVAARYEADCFAWKFVRVFAVVLLAVRTHADVTCAFWSTVDLFGFEVCREVVV
jgi:hypothetical protein